MHIFKVHGRDVVRRGHRFFAVPKPIKTAELHAALSAGGIKRNPFSHIEANTSPNVLMRIYGEHRSAGAKLTVSISDHIRR